MQWKKLAVEIRGWFVKNWPIKLTALVLAAILWGATAAQEPATQLVDVELDVVPPEGRALVAQLPEVKALYAGRTRELIKLYRQPPLVHKVIPDTLTGASYTLELSLADLSVMEGADVRAQAIEPRIFTVVLDDVFQRSVPVVPQVTVVPDSGYEQFGDARAEPGSVIVRGPEEVVRAVVGVNTEPLEVSGVSEPFTRTLSLDTAALGVLSVSHTEVEISVEVASVADRVIMGVPVTIQAPGGGAWDSDPPAVMVTVRGRAERLAELTRDSLQVVADITGSQTDTTIALQVIPPEGLTAWVTPDSSVIRRRQ
jgi:YbbR domain-containing protein